MGRPGRKTGHLAGTFPEPKIKPREGNREAGPSRPPPLQPQPGVSIPQRQPNLHANPVQYYFYTAPVVFTPSTTDAVSPVSSRSGLSPGTSSTRIAHNVPLDYDQLSLPDIATPDSSSSIAAGYQSPYAYRHTLQQPTQVTTYANDYVLVSDHGMTEDVMGIEDRVPLHETAPYIATSPRFLTSKNPSPTRFQNLPGIQTPWSSGHLRQDQLPGGLGMSPTDAMDFEYQDPNYQQGRGGGRKGPLSLTQRQGASDVRKNGACLRCSIMKEKCDSNNPCNSCLKKDRRKAPRTCFARQFDWKAYQHILFPKELADKMRAPNLFRDLANASFLFISRHSFEISLDLWIGIPLHLMVQEFDPLNSADVCDAFTPVLEDGGETVLRHCPTWNPPIIMHARDQRQLNQQMDEVRSEVIRVFDQVLNNADAWEAWTWKYFSEETEDFQAEILQVIGKFYNRNLAEHHILRVSLLLLWYEYLLRCKLCIQAKTLSGFQTHLNAKKPHADIEWVVPDMINRFLKAVILPFAEKCAKQLTEYLHDMLFKQALTPKSSTTGRNDLALCLLLILNMYLGRTQGTLLLQVGTPAHGKMTEYTKADAEGKIREMEQIGEHFASLHRYTLSRCPRGTTASTDASSAFEAHSRSFGFMAELSKAVQPHAHLKPDSFDELGALDGTYFYKGVRRLCWRALDNIKALD